MDIKWEFINSDFQDKITHDIGIAEIQTHSLNLSAIMAHLYYPTINV